MAKKKIIIILKIILQLIQNKNYGVFDSVNCHSLVYPIVIKNLRRSNCYAHFLIQTSQLLNILF